ncbi:hypothetical protein ABPG72_012134 [Tetrahymena utriculariae]
MKEEYQIDKELDFLAFADDLAIIAEDQQEFQIIMETFQNKMKEYGLEVNLENSEYVIFNKSNKSKSIEMEFKKVDIIYVNECFYLPSNIITVDYLIILNLYIYQPTFILFKNIN